MIELSDWKAKGKLVELNGYNIFTLVDGDPKKPTLLLIHGFPSASWDWEGMWKMLIKHFHLVTLDMLGFGFSDKPKNIDYLITQQADIFESFLKQLNIDAYHIIAHDYGDTVAQELLARQVKDNKYDHIKSVCLLNGGLFPETHRPVLIQKSLLSPLGFLISKLTSKSRFSNNLHHIFGPLSPPSQQVIQGLWDLLVFNNGLAVMHKLIDYIKQRREHRDRWVGALIDTQIQIKLISGSLDPISGKHMTDRYRELIPNANVTELPLLGHYPQVENAKAVSEAYLAFRESIYRY
ncbi:MAG: alpha/beta hydrolase [Colwellia sp.]|nr:alpha/beta hydrolase [Colwellia sp.]